MWGIRSALIASVAAVGLLGGCAQVTGGTGSGPPAPTYPFLEAADYAYTLQIRCFCGNDGVPIEVTVEDGRAVSGIYLEDAYNGVEAGEPAAERTWLTLNDVIAAANDTEAFSVGVDWPEGQRWPNRVSVDPQENTIDEEYGYLVSDVVLRG